MRRPKICVLRAAGTNCDMETAFAFSRAGALAELVHINSFISRQKKLKDYQILAIPGGFTYGDDVAAGKILANELRYKLIEDIKKFVREGKLIIGICNGFQALVKSGLLPGNSNLEQEATLFINDSGKFEDRWIHLKTPPAVGWSACGGNSASRRLVRLRRKLRTNKCIWTKDLPEIIYLPVAHGEGKFVAKDKSVLERLQKNGQIVFQYCNEKGRLVGYPDNPNGSEENIAGICDETGRIFGLMPHPERHIAVSQHPRWEYTGKNKEGDGLKIIRNGVEYARKNL